MDGAYSEGFSTDKNNVDWNITFGRFSDMDDSDLSEEDTNLKNSVYVPFEALKNSVYVPFEAKHCSNDRVVDAVSGLVAHSTINFIQGNQDQTDLKIKAANPNNESNPLERAIDLQLSAEEYQSERRMLTRSAYVPSLDRKINSVQKDGGNSVSSAYSATLARKGECEIREKQAIPFKDIQLLRVIGKGSTGKVWKGQWKSVTVAVKEAKNINSEIDLEKEANLLKQVSNHRSVVQFYGITSQPLRIVTEFMARGSLHDLLKNDQINLNWVELGRFALEAAQGVVHLHSESIIHRDLAARNFLVDEDMHIRVADFGFSRVMKEEYSHGSTESAFPFKWTAPEVVRPNTRRHRYDTKTDIFSFGVVLFEIFSRQDPWHDESGISAFILVQQGYRMPLPRHWPESLKQLIGICWAHKPQSRPASMTEVLETLSSMDFSTFVDEVSLADEIEII